MRRRAHHDSCFTRTWASMKPAALLRPNAPTTFAQRRLVRPSLWACPLRVSAQLNGDLALTFAEIAKTGGLVEGLANHPFRSRLERVVASSWVSLRNRSSRSPSRLVSQLTNPTGSTKRKWGPETGAKANQRSSARVPQVHAHPTRLVTTAQ
jgi:hypothetical protein